jgi:hypothetical protein
MKHQPNPEEPERCLATDLLVTDCSGCRGSDESFVNALLSTEPEPAIDYGDPDDDPNPDQELAARALTPIPRDRFWLRTGEADPRTAVRTSRTFRANYTGSKCPLCPKPINAGQWIVNTNLGYAHTTCMAVD